MDALGPGSYTDSASSPAEKKRNGKGSAGFMGTAQRGLLEEAPNPSEKETRLLDSVLGVLARTALRKGRRSPQREKLVLVQYTANGSTSVPMEKENGSSRGLSRGVRKPGYMFVSKLPRSVPDLREVAKTPGPGDYHREEDWVKSNRRPNRGASPVQRSSNTGSGRESNGRDVLKGNAYAEGETPNDVKSDFLTKQPSQKILPRGKSTMSVEPGFESRAPRFASIRNDGASNPGPGAYYNSDATSSFVENSRGPLSDLHKLGLINRETLWGTTGRFTDRTNNWTPGPGAYDAEDPYSSVVKRTFNISLDAPRDPL
jgi:hypothetical protein